MGEQSFEDALKRLEEVVEMLEDGRLALEEALELYAEGVLMARHCHGILEQAEQRIGTLAAAENPAPGSSAEGGASAEDGFSPSSGGEDQARR